MHVGCGKRNQGFAGAAFGDYFGGLAAGGEILGDAHDRDILGGKRGA
jgi:hypothetical protein